MDLPIAIFIIYIVIALITRARKRPGGGKPRERFDRVRGRNPQTGEGVSPPQSAAPAPAPEKKQPAAAGRLAPAREKRRLTPAGRMGAEPEAGRSAAAGRLASGGAAQAGRRAHQPGRPAAPARGLQERALRWIENLEEQITSSAAGEGGGKGQPLSFDGGEGGGGVVESRREKATAHTPERTGIHAESAEEHGSLTLTGRQAPRREGPAHDETVMHMYGLDECASPVEEFLEDGRKGELSLAEGMIWSQILGQPRCRVPAFRHMAGISPAKR
ncbi:MAG: hypothetical protein FWG28_02365 [Clostridiales bacterium]|nr:hypothetical protein [Clostridiales bacterium]